MDTKCAVCNKGAGYVLCDGCGRPVCFNCFHFANSRRLCTVCINEWEAKRRWQKYAEQYTRMTVDERAGLWATLSPEERAMLESELDLWSSGSLQRQHRTSLWKYSWMALPIVACFIVILLLTDRQLWDQASVAGKKLESKVGSLAGSVRREVVDLSASTPVRGKTVAAADGSQQLAPIQMVGQKLRTDGLPVTAGNLRMKPNPGGAGAIVYSPYYYGPNRRLAWLVIDGKAYALTQTSEEVTPGLGTSRAIPASVWKKAGLTRENIMGQLQSLWE